jgi:hypothetical protein
LISQEGLVGKTCKSLRNQMLTRIVSIVVGYMLSVMS